MARLAHCFLATLVGIHLSLATPSFFARDSPAAAQSSPALALGKIIDKVVCAADPSQSYALYLPSNYTSDRKWPILYAFDPGARGRMAVESFQEVAEQYGYIVVGSNNSRNGPWEVSLAAIRAVAIDTQTRFSVDGKRIYTAGFSGGARVATAMAQALHGRVAGVIACGAGFPLGTGQGPTKDTPFAFFATAGIRDFNFSELRELDQTLDRLGVIHRVEVFDGGHQWASKTLALDAFEWMEIQAMKSGRRDKDDALIKALYTKRSEEARRLDAEGDPAQAFHHYQWLAADFRGLCDVTEVEARLKAIKDSKELGKTLKREQNREASIARIEADYYASFERAMATVSDPSTGEYERRQAIRELRLTEMRQIVAKKKDTEEGIAAQRYVYGVMVHLMEEGMQAVSTGDSKRAKVDLEIAAESAPDNGYVQYQLARVYAVSKDNRSALAALRRSVENGFLELDQIEKNPDFASLRGESSYLETVELLKKKREPASPAPH